jgi:O-glycosyl hydrolase
MRRARRRGVKLLFTASNAPSSMKRGNGLAAGAERRFARYIAAILAYARRLGVPFQLSAIGNEIDNPDDRIIPLQMAPAQAARVYDALTGELRRRGLRTRLALADTKDWAGGARYAGAALRSRRVRRHARILATHAYGGDSSRGEVRSVARRNRLRIWMTEWTGSDCPRGDCRDRPEIGFALRWAAQITRDLQQPGVTAWFVFRAVDDSTHGPDSGIIVRTRDNPDSPFYLTKRFHVLRQFTSAAPPGARRLEVSGGLPALAFRRGRRLALVVTNPDSREVTANVVLGRRRGRVAIRRTSGHENFRRLPTQAYDGGSIAVRLPPASVSTFTLVPARSSR